MPVRSPLPRRILLTAAVAALALLPVACGDDEDDSAGDPVSAPVDPDGGLDDAPIGDGVPEECAVFIGTIEPADPADLDALPAEWPEPPAGSTLCSVSHGGTTTIQYASDTVPDEVLTYYETELGASWDPVREAGAGDEILTGYSDTVGFQIQPRDGGFRISITDDAA